MGEMSEETIKKIMGENYHICQTCSSYMNADIREFCSKNQPSTKDDINKLYKKIKKDIKFYFRNN